MSSRGDMLGRKVSVHGERRVGTLMGWGRVLQKETLLLAWSRMASGFAGGRGRVGDKELLGRWPVSSQRGSPGPRSFVNLGKVVPRAAARQCPCQGTAAVGKLTGTAAGTARRGGPGDAQEARGMLLSTLPEMLRGCSGVPGGCCPRCSEEAACPGGSGRCLPGC